MNMNRALSVLAFLGVVMIAFTTHLFVPNTPTGRTIVFLAFGVAFYPLARYLWFSTQPAWRYWVGMTLGAFSGWALDTWRTTQAWSESTNGVVGVMVVILATTCLAIAAWRDRRARQGRG